MVRRAREISNTRHNSKDCLQPPDHQVFWWFFLQENKQEFENEIKNINHRRNILRNNHHQCPRRDKMRGVEWHQYDVYVSKWHTNGFPRMDCDMHHKWGKHTGKRHRRMQQHKWQFTRTHCNGNNHNVKWL